MAQPPNVGQQQQLLQAIGQLENVRRSTDLPPFYGDPKLDTITPEAFLERLENATVAGGWAPARRLTEFKLALRGKADSWFTQQLPWRNIDQNNWGQVEAAFRECYCPTMGALTITRGFQDLNQGVGETVRDFFTRIGRAMSKGFEDTDDIMHEGIAALIAPAVAGDGDGGGVPAAPGHPANNAAAQFLLLEGKRRSLQMVMDAIFRSGLRPELRARVSLRAIRHQLNHNYIIALEEEAKMGEELNKKTKGTFVTSISGERIELASLGEEELNSLAGQISALKTGDKKPFKKGKGKFTPQAGQENKGGNTFKGRSTSKYPTGVNEKGERCCFKCGGTAHIAINCHVQPKVHAVDGGAQEARGQEESEGSNSSGIFNLFY